jgi:hypothetical protein
MSYQHEAELRAIFFDEEAFQWSRFTRFPHVALAHRWTANSHETHWPSHIRRRWPLENDRGFSRYWLVP